MRDGPDPDKTSTPARDAAAEAHTEPHMAPGARTPANPPSAQLLGRRIIDFDPDAGRGSFAYVALPEFSNRHGTVQGGLLAAMLDSATGFTLIEGLAEGLTAVTRDLSIRFLKPAEPGDIFADAHVVARDERNATVEGVLRNRDGVALASAVATMRIVPRQT